MTKPKILIIDDEVDYCILMKAYFQDKNYEVFLAHTLKDGLTKMNTAHPDILFLDNNLPDGKGWDCVDKFVENFPHMRIYLISAYRQKSDILNPSQNVVVWEKPISFSTLNTVFS